MNDAFRLGGRPKLKLCPCVLVSVTLSIYQVECTHDPGIVCEQLPENATAPLSSLLVELPPRTVQI